MSPSTFAPTILAVELARVKFVVAGKHVDRLRRRDHEFLRHLQGVDGVAAAAQVLDREACMCGGVEL